jgi:hypothetical protein
MFQDKAQSAAKGRSLGKGCNAGLGHLGGSLRARRYAASYFVAFLMKGLKQYLLAIHGETRRVSGRISSR